MNKNGSNIGSDHDLLIELNTKFGIFMVQNKNDMEKLRDGYTSKIHEHDLKFADLEKRTSDLEDLKDRLNPEEVVKDFRSLQSEIHDFKLGAKIWIVVIGMAGGFISWVITKIPSWWGIIFK